MALIGISGYLLAGCAYLVFILLLLAARNNTLSGRRGNTNRARLFLAIGLVD